MYAYENPVVLFYTAVAVILIIFYFTMWGRRHKTSVEDVDVDGSGRGQALRSNTMLEEARYRLQVAKEATMEIELGTAALNLKSSYLAWREAHRKGLFPSAEEKTSFELEHADLSAMVGKMIGGALAEKDKHLKEHPRPISPG